MEVTKDINLETIQKEETNQNDKKIPIKETNKNDDIEKDPSNKLSINKKDDIKEDRYYYFH
jgi:hypothetical protein